MKKILLSLTFCFSVFMATAQKTESNPPYPESFLDLGVGIGSNYGVIGFKSVLGYKGNGLMIGVGSIEGNTASSIGIQLAYKHLFLNIASSTLGYYRTERGLLVDEGLVKGTSVIFGGRVSFDRAKRIFIELGFGFSSGEETDRFGQKIEMRGPSFNLGFGYRIGGYEN